MSKASRPSGRARIGLVALLLAASAWVAHAKAPGAARGPHPSPAPSTAPPAGVIEAVFVLDTTGSMSGLIEGAKQKIWSIANSMADASQETRIRIGLIGYRDRGDAYVTRRFDLTEDIDSVYDHLFQFTADGGGDTPESVNQALHEAVTTMDWTGGKGVYRVVFLVGDAPPHMDYAGDVPFAETARLAAQRDIVINTVQCGNVASTSPVWREIASLARGEFSQVAQDGAMVAIRTPLDDELAQLNRELAATILPYGSDAARAEVKRKRDLSAAAPAPAAAERLAFLAKRGGRANLGSMDLLDAVSSGALEPADVPEAELPAELRPMAPEAREQFVKDQLAKRGELRQKIEALSAERDELVRAEREERARAGKADGFDEKVLGLVRSQAKARGLEYGE